LSQAFRACCQTRQGACRCARFHWRDLWLTHREESSGQIGRITIFPRASACGVGSETDSFSEEDRLVRFENVGLRYGMGPEVLKDINFNIEPRSFQYLTGPSGAGKTTLMRLILMALKPTRGLVNLFGQDVSRLEPDTLTAFRRRMGVVFQDFRLLDHLTVYENVALPLRVLGKEEASYRAEVVELLRWVGLGERMHAVPPVLSGGEKQRAAIARALISRPELLLADEPTGNVDPGLGRRLLRLFMELQSLGTAVLIATHDLNLMEIYDAPRLVLADGHLHVDA